MNDLLLHMQSVLQRMNAGNLHAEELNEAVESARMLYERLIVIRHRAYDRLGKGDSLSSAYNFRLDRYVPVNQTSLFDAIHEIEVEKSKGEQSSLFTLEEESIDVEPKEESTEVVIEPVLEEELSEEEVPENGEAFEVKEEVPSSPQKEETLAITDEKEPQEEEVAPSLEEEIRPEDQPTENEQQVQSKEELKTQPEKTSPTTETIGSTGSTSIAEKLEKTPLSDLKSAIGLNRKFQFINTLFDGDGSAYDAAIQFLNQDQNAAEVPSWIENKLPKEFEDEDEQNVLEAFIELIERRHS